MKLMCGGLTEHFCSCSLSKSPARKSSNGATSVKSTKADQRKTISWEEVQKHTSADDCWLVLGNKVRKCPIVYLYSMWCIGL